MVNCLITKLKSAVDNDNLRKKNVFYIDVLNNGRSGDLTLVGKPGTTISTTGSGTFTVGSDLTVRTTYTFSSNALETLHFSAGEYKIELSDKYEQRINIINNLNDATNFSFDLEQLNYVSRVDNFRINLSQLVGKCFVDERADDFCIYGGPNTDQGAVICLKDDVNYTRLRNAFGCPVIKSMPINIERLGSCTGLTAITANLATDISGEVDTLFAALHSAGKISGSVPVFAYSGNITDEGNRVTLDYLAGKGGTTCIKATFTSEGYTKSYE